jgi:hypothetical protein
MPVKSSWHVMYLFIYYLFIDFATKKHCFHPLTMDEVNIERAKSARILGLTVQDNMK